MAKASLKKGIFITFEGMEGCGKSTHSKLLVNYLKNRGYPCIHTREPGGTNLGEEIRVTLLKSKNINISDLAELFLFEACRAQLVKDVIKPALNKKKIVICDRFSDATLSYQGYGGNVDINMIKTLNRLATGNLSPDMTLLLDIDTAKGLKRAGRKGVDRMELKGIAYHKKVRNGYLKLAKVDPKRIKVIKVDGAIDRVQAIIRKEVERVIC
jgi:dTMP kinase